MTICNELFNKWAGNRQYHSIVERDFWAVWKAAWDAAIDKVDAELEGIECSNALRDHIKDVMYK